MVIRPDAFQKIGGSRIIRVPEKNDIQNSHLMKMQFETEKDFTGFKEELRHILASRECRCIDNTQFTHAAVMMLFMNKGNEPHVLLTRRTDTVSTHKGQVSFPGGAYDEDDRNLLATAYRETCEEVGIGQDKIEYIGQFDDYISISGFRVSSFVGAIDYPYDFKLNHDEIESHLEAPLSMFVNREFDRYEMFPYEGSEHKVYFYSHEGYEIWGLTARILTDFGKVLKASGFGD